MILVTGGAGFIGANFVLDWLASRAMSVWSTSTRSPTPATCDNLDSLKNGNTRHVFVQGDICDRAHCSTSLFAEHQPRAVVHFAAESHVDRSIHGPGEFMQAPTCEGTFTLLEAARAHWSTWAAQQGDAKSGVSLSCTCRPTRSMARSHQDRRQPFTETHAYEPNSPYSASKAASDHLVRAWHHTYGLPVRDDQLLEQLRPLSLPRKADPVDDRQCTRRQGAAGVRRRPCRSAIGST